MHMTDEQKYNAVLKELGELLQSKNTTISCKQWQIDELKAKLADAEKEMADNAKNIAILTAECDMLKAQKEAAEKELREARPTEVRYDDKGMYLLLDNNSIDALRAINAQLRELYARVADDIDCAEFFENVQGAIKFILPIKGGAA